MFKLKIKKFIKNHSNCMWSKEFFKVEQKYWLKLPLPLKLPQITVFINNKMTHTTCKNVKITTLPTELSILNPNYDH